MTFDDIANVFASNFSEACKIIFSFSFFTSHSVLDSLAEVTSLF
jgi:hypothetical protein